jgi:pimeloyl-ACP methyl ester carboxylesterase
MAGVREASQRATPRPGRIREYRLTLNGARTRAIEVEGSGKPVVMLHGFCDSADTWRNVLEPLAASGRAAIAYDMPGFGFSAPVRFPIPLLDQQVAFAAAAVQRAAEQTGEEVLVAGNSLGGWTSLRLAERDDLPLAGIIPVAPAGIAMAPWFLQIDRVPGVGQLLRLPGPVPEVVTRAVVARTVRRIGFGDPAKIDERFVRSFTLHNRNRRWAFPRMAAAAGCRSEMDAPFDPEKVKVPSAVVWGTRDALCLIKGAEPLAAQLGAKLFVVDGCGHLPQVECPDSVLDAIEHLS